MGDKGRHLTAEEKKKLASYGIPQVDLDNAILHAGPPSLDDPVIKNSKLIQSYLIIPGIEKQVLQAAQKAEQGNGTGLTLYNDIYVMGKTGRLPKENLDLGKLAVIAHELVHVGQYRRGELTPEKYIKEAIRHGMRDQNIYEIPAIRMGDKVNNDDIVLTNKAARLGLSLMSLKTSSTDQLVDLAKNVAGLSDNASDVFFKLKDTRFEVPSGGSFTLGQLKQNLNKAEHTAIKDNAQYVKKVYHIQPKDNVFRKVDENLALGFSNLAQEKDTLASLEKLSPQDKADLAKISRFVDANHIEGLVTFNGSGLDHIPAPLPGGNPIPPSLLNGKNKPSQKK